MTVDKLVEMAQELEIPHAITTPNRNVFFGIEALGFTCAHFRTGGDLHKLAMKHCCSQSGILDIVNWLVTYIDCTWSHLLDFDQAHLLTSANLQKYADIIHSAGAPLTGIWGFIDRTI